MEPNSVAQELCFNRCVAMRWGEFACLKRCDRDLPPMLGEALFPPILELRKACAYQFMQLVMKNMDLWENTAICPFFSCFCS